MMGMLRWFMYKKVQGRCSVIISTKNGANYNVHVPFWYHEGCVACVA